MSITTFFKELFEDCTTVRPPESPNSENNLLNELREVKAKIKKLERTDRWGFEVTPYLNSIVGKIEVILPCGTFASSFNESKQRQILLDALQEAIELEELRIRRDEIIKQLDIE